MCKLNSKCFTAYNVSDLNERLTKFINKLERGNYSIYHITNIVREPLDRGDGYSLILIYTKDK